MERRKAQRLTRPQGGSMGTWVGREQPVQRIANPQKNQTEYKSNPIRTILGDGVSVGAIECKPGTRRSRSDRRYAEMLVERAAWIPTVDRALIEAVYGEGLSVVGYVRRCLDRGVVPVERAVFGGGAGRADLDAWSRAARRRLRRVVARLGSDRFAFVIARRNTWATSRRRVAMACVLHGNSLRQASRDLGLSLHTVRRHMEAVDAMFEAYREAGAQARSAIEAAIGEGSAR